jgi:hypothetical protein
VCISNQNSVLPAGDKVWRFKPLPLKMDVDPATPMAPQDDTKMLLDNYATADREHKTLREERNRLAGTEELKDLSKRVREAQKHKDSLKEAILERVMKRESKKKADKGGEGSKAMKKRPSKWGPPADSSELDTPYINASDLQFKGGVHDQ